jgi:hypothetical protein
MSFTDIQYISATQTKQFTPQKYSENSQEPETEKINSIFHDVENALSSNDVDLLTQHIFKQVKLTLRDAENGYFSENQAIYIIKNYFTTHKVINFKFTLSRISAEPPFATGGGYWNMKGKQEKFQVYITVTERDKRWVLAQFIIY